MGPELAAVSYAQRRVWFIEQLADGRSGYVIVAALTLTGSVDPERLQEALNVVVARHEVLRTSYVQEGDELVQAIWAEMACELEQVVDAGEPRGRAASHVREVAARPFDLRRGPVLRARLVRFDETHWLLVLAVHHIAADGWSMGVLAREVMALYASPGLVLRPLAVQYADFAHWQSTMLEEGELGEQIAYWRNQLADVRSATLPSRPRPSVFSYRGTSLAIALSKDDSSALDAFAQRQGVTPFMVLLAIWSLLVARRTGVYDVVVGSPVAARNRQDLEPIIGFVANTLALRSRFSPRTTVRELIAIVRRTCLDAYANQDVPFEHLVESISPERDMGHTPFFQTLFVLQNAPLDELVLPELSVELLETPSFSAKFDVMISLARVGESHRGVVEYSTDLFDERDAERLWSEYQRLLRSAMSAPDEPCGALPMMSDDDRRARLDASRGATRDRPPRWVVDRVLEVARGQPDAIAVEEDGSTVTYGELVSRARAVATGLAARGVGPSDVCGLALDRGIEQMVALLGVLMAGAAYVPIDPAYPRERRAIMLEDAGASCLFAAPDDPLVEAGARRLDVRQLQDARGTPPTVPNRPDAVAYVIFTSGSTGRPKGIAMTRGVLDGLVDWQLERTSDRRAATLQFTSISFDVSFQEIFATWCGGGRLVLVDEVTRRDPVALLPLLSKTRVQRIFLPFVALSQLVEHAGTAARWPSTLTEIVTAGEQLVVTDAVRAVLECQSGLVLDNHYGPAETHVVTACRLDGGGARWPELPDIGHPIAGAEVYVLDDEMRLLADDAIGRIYVGGSVLSRGYVGRPRLTAERFVPSPFAKGERLYDTGDLGRRRPDGSLQFVGRADHQVKIRGFRVEPGEVEAVLASHPMVRHAVVVARAAGAAGLLQLVGYVVTDPPGRGVDVRDLHRFARDKLPDYATPTSFVVLDTLPLTPSGKVDRGRLPDPDAAALGGAGQIEPETEAERAVASAVGELLGVPRVGVDASFFDLGGHSLLAARLVARLRTTVGVELSVRDVFETPRVGDLARRLEAGAPHQDVDGPTRRKSSDVLVPLSHAQRRLWFLQELEPESTAYNVAAAVRLRGPLDVEALRHSFGVVVERHEALRSRIVVDADGRPFQHVLPDVPGALDLVDLGDDGSPEQRLAVEMRRRASSRFDLEAAPAVRATLVRLGEHHHVFLLTMHHMVTDGWSMALIVRELMENYGAFRRDGVVPVLPKPLGYPDYAAWERALPAEVLEPHIAYFERQLRGAPPFLDLPRDRPRPRRPERRGASLSLTLPDELKSAVDRLSRDTGASAFMTLLSAFGVLLARSSGQNDIVIGTPVASRPTTALEEVVGCFINMIPLRMTMDLDGAFRDLLGRVRQTVLDAFAHQHLRFERLVEALDLPRDANRAPVFQVAFNMLNFGLTLKADELEIELFELEVRDAKLDLNLYAHELDGRLQLELVYDRELFTATRAAEFLAQYRLLLEAFTKDPDRPIGLASLVTERARALLPNPAATPAPSFDGDALTPILAAFGAYADRPAVRDASGSHTYADLDRGSAAVAAGLAARGVKANDRVAIVAARGVELVMALIGVWRVGAAFVILDPSYPLPRLTRQVALCEPSIVVALPSTTKAAEQLGGERAYAPDWTASAETNDVPPDPGSEAYVAFTSGTTGEPMGIVGEHAPLAHFFAVAPATFDLRNDDRFSMLSGLAHDPLLRDALLPLTIGATVCIPPTDVLEDAPQLVAWLSRERVSVLHLTPARGETIVLGAGPGVTLPVRRAIFGGDQLTMSLVRRWYELAPEGVVTNSYGATETPQIATAFTPRRDADLPVVPVGRGIDGFSLVVVNRARHQAGVGEAGEIAIVSPHLARGYLHGPASSRFGAHPVAGSRGGRAFMTGDLGRYQPDGTVTVEGRVDEQVKIRGFRVEPEELRVALRRLRPVADAAVLVERGPAPTLTACVVSEEGEVDVGELRAALADELPVYMMPTRIVAVDAIPLTANQKVDRRALRELVDSVDVEPSVLARPPETPQQRQLAELWAKALDVPEAAISLDSDFFQLGGHSLLATRLLADVRRHFEVTFTLREFLANPRLDAMAAALADKRRGDVGIAEDAALRPAPEAAHEPFPVTDVQQAYLVGRRGDFELGGVSTHAYVELDARDLDLSRFAAALNAAIARHPALRLVMTQDGQQRVLEIVPPYVITTMDLTNASEADRRRALEVVRTTMSHQVIDAERWPLFEVRASRWADTTRLHVSIDALILDAHSRTLVARDIMAVYRDPGRALTPLTCTFRDYVLALEAFRDTEAHGRAWAYWNERLEEFPGPPELPIVTSPSQIERPHFTSRTTVVDEQTWSTIKRRSATRGLTASTIILSCFCEVLQAWSTTPRFAMNVTLFNRLPVHAEVNEVAGDFTTLELLDVDMSCAADLCARARALQARLWEDLDHAAVGGLALMRDLRRRRGTAEIIAPIVFTSTLGFAQPSEDDYGDLFSVAHAVSQTPQVWLDNVVSEDATGRLELRWNSIDELFPAGMVDAMFGELERLLRELAVDDERWDRDDPIVPVDDAAARARVNDTGCSRPSALLHQLRRPSGAVGEAAIVTLERSIDHAELDARVAGLANLMRGSVSPGDRVGIVMRKGWEQVVAAYAVLEVGAVYVPIQASLPEERVHHLLASIEARVCITQPDLVDDLRWPDEIAVMAVDDTLEASPQPPTAHASVDDLAYVIFTSGSTGLPKGVMINHLGAVNTILDINRRFEVTERDRVLALSSLSFDLSVYDVFGVVGAGGAIVIPDADDLRDPAHWAHLVRRAGVTIWNSVPALMLLFVEYLENHPDEVPESLRLVMMSGDWIPVDLPGRIRSLMPEVDVVSLGGATEGSIWSILYPVGVVEPDWVSIPYGRPMDNQSFHVLDHALRPRPTWVPGELYIGGVGVALGYWRDAERTKAQFFDHPRTGERLYRTGDWGRYLPSGDIEFLGRQDTQVKIQGYRIELGEIEHALNALEDVELAVAVAEGPPNGRRLAAYVIPVSSRTDVPSLRSELAGRLPPYMVPQRLVLVEALPLTANGKVDRKALARLGQPSKEVAATPAASTALERRITDVLTDVLGVDIPDPSTNLLALGADSVGIIRAANRLEKELGHRPRLVDVYREPTVRALAGLYARASSVQVSARSSQDDRIVDPEGRESFKRRVMDELRRGMGEGTSLGRPPTLDPSTVRRSWRHFDAEPLDAADLDTLLAPLAATKVGRQLKFRYASAGGLYAVRVLIHVKPGRVSGLSSGTYIYDPAEHQLVARADTSLDAIVYGPFLNGPIFASAAFAMHFVWRRDVIHPLYGEDAPRFAAIEAGLMTALVEGEAERRGLGFCHIGGMDEGEVSRGLGLTSHERLVHTLFGGRPADPDAPWSAAAPLGLHERAAEEETAGVEEDNDERERFEL